MTGNTKTTKKLKTIYNQLLACYGPQHWWPGETPFEIVAGAILTQSAAWGNVEKAIGNLKESGNLSPSAIRELPIAELAKLVYPSGYYNAKARKLKALAEWLGRYGDDLSRLDSRPTGELRQELLNVYGIGEETADGILLYALCRPVFVLDAYTRRLFSRLGIKPDRDTYDGWQKLFMDNLPTDLGLFAEYHALIIRQGKDKCRKTARCEDCCLGADCAERIRPSTSSGRTD
jgi:endonuclease III related protein